VLDGQVAIVTGAARGIGRVVAQGLAAAGAAVCLTARSADLLHEAATAIVADGGQALAIPADLTERAAVAHLVAETEERLGPVDLLVNNAGGVLEVGLPWEVDPDVWWAEVEINLRTAYLCTWAVLPNMLQRRRGRVIMMASNAGIRPFPANTAYGAAKAAMLRFTDSAATSAREGNVQFFAISPGSVRTEAWEQMMASDAGQRYLGGLLTMPAGAFLGPEQTASMCVRLASGVADALSGRYIHVSQDLDALIAQSEEIQARDLYMLRLRTE
jgi:NAD(P)-dependent dehydrogenase (short-subunit alcohol dehydrogenase family)